MVNLELLPLSFAAGVATFFSPCFGAMLPAYVSSTLGRREAAESWWAKARQGLTLGAVVSAGFLTSFSGLGLLFGWIGSAIGRYLPWVAVSVGFLIVALGAVMLIWPTVSPSLGGPAGRWMRLVGGQGLRSFYVYGILYAICAAACTLPIFLSVMMQTFISGGVLGGLLSFLAYGWGMSAVMLVFSLGLAYSKGVVYRLLPRLTAGMSRLSGLFLVLAGGYVLYYLLIYGRYLEELWR